MAKAPHIQPQNAYFDDSRSAILESRIWNQRSESQQVLNQRRFTTTTTATANANATSTATAIATAIATATTTCAAAPASATTTQGRHFSL